jgi:hypothetical protein
MSLLLFASAASAQRHIPPAPIIRLNCTGDVTPTVSRLGGTDGVAVSQEVQVNVGKAAPQGVLMVDPSHSTACTASIDSPYRLVTGNALRDPKNSDDFKGMDQRALDQSLSFYPNRLGTSLVFTMYPVNAGVVGTANYRFYIIYKR